MMLSLCYSGRAPNGNSCLSDEEIDEDHDANDLQDLPHSRSTTC